MFSFFPNRKEIIDLEIRLVDFHRLIDSRVEDLVDGIMLNFMFIVEQVADHIFELVQATVFIIF